MGPLDAVTNDPSGTGGGGEGPPPGELLAAPKPSVWGGGDPLPLVVHSIRLGVRVPPPLSSPGGAGRNS